jgi:hypothetical protein
MGRRTTGRQFLRNASLGVAAVAGSTALGGLASRMLPHAVAEDLSAYIDPEIQGYEREVMLDVLAKLPAEHRQNVVYVNSLCQLFVNRVKLREVTEFLQPVSEDVYLTSWGQEIVMPSDTEEYDGGPPGGEGGMSQMDADPYAIDPYAITICESQKGPYRRMQSKEGTSTKPYNVVRSFVWLPSAAAGDIKMNRKDETPHIYHSCKNGAATQTGLKAVYCGIVKTTTGGCSLSWLRT